MRQCTRFRRDGSPCPNETDYADGWCRSPECPGFKRPEQDWGPESLGAPHGTAKHIRESGDMAVGDLDIDDVEVIRVSRTALDSFRFHHGGDAIAAEVELRSMLEDFLVQSAKQTSRSDYLRLARQGFQLILSPHRDVITGYSTIHRERTWSQVKSGVRSRFKRRPNPQLHVPTREQGPPVDIGGFRATWDASSAHLTVRVKRSYASIAELRAATPDELEAAIRSAAADLGEAAVQQRQDGLFEVTLAGQDWLVAPDAQSLIGVRATRTDAASTSGFEGSAGATVQFSDDSERRSRSELSRANDE